MTNLLDLPTECLLQILHFLKAHHIQIFAQTFDRRILELCLPLLVSKLAKDRNKRRMKTIFGKTFPMTINLNEFSKACFDFGDTRLSWPDDPSDHLQYLELNGQPNWLLTTVKEEDATVQELRSPDNDITVADIENFRSLAKQLNIEKAVPDIFWRLGADDSVTRGISNGIPSESTPCFTMHDVCKISAENLAQIRAKRERTGSDTAWKQWKHQEGDDYACGDNAIAAENYIFTFYFDPAVDSNDIYRKLFLDTNGGHCVLISDPYERLHPGPEYTRHLQRRGFEHLKTEADSILSSDGKALTIRDLTFDEADDLYLEATDLEEWLVTMTYVESVRDGSTCWTNQYYICYIPPSMTAIQRSTGVEEARAPRKLYTYFQPT